MRLSLKTYCKTGGRTFADRHGFRGKQIIIVFVKKNIGSFASLQISVGAHVVLPFRPIAWSLTEFEDTIEATAVVQPSACVTCDLPDDPSMKMKVCVCRTALYCSVDCQQQGWGKHRKTCHGARMAPLIRSLRRKVDVLVLP